MCAKLRHHCTIASPLCALTEKDVPFVLSSEFQCAFKQFKQILSEALVLIFPVKGTQFVLNTDASDRGIGVVLSQLIPVGVNSKGEV